MFSRRVSDIKPSGIREMFEMASKDAINLGLGELDFDPPEEAKEAMKRALDRGTSRYGPTKGIDELRETVADHLRRYNSSISAKNVMITASGTEGTIAAFQAMFDPGDQVLIPDPGFVLYHPNCVLSGAVPVSYGLEERQGFLPNIEEIASLVNEKTKAIVVNSPSNPTGSVLDRERFQAIIDLARDRDLWIISDEVYENFIYEGRHHSFCEALERSVVLNSFSKSLAIPGWRIGYLATSEQMMEQIAKMQYHLVACPPTPAQYAIKEIFHIQEKFAKGLIPIFDRRRRLMTSLLNDIPGFRCRLPQGAFYTFPSFDTKTTSRDLAKKIVGAGVICAPGAAFGERGEGHLRFSYAASEDKIVKGLDLVREVVEKIE